MHITKTEELPTIFNRSANLMTMKLFKLQFPSAIIVAQPPFFVFPCCNTFWNKMQISWNEFYKSTNRFSSMGMAVWIGIDEPIYVSMYWTFGNSSKDDRATPGRPASINNHFKIGSISKMFGATINLLLMESGKYPDFTLNAMVQEVSSTDFADMFPQYAVCQFHHGTAHGHAVGYTRFLQWPKWAGAIVNGPYISVLHNSRNCCIHNAEVSRNGAQRLQIQPHSRNWT